MKFLGVIPARYHSTRFPGKPLCLIGGKPMIQRVYEQVAQVKEFQEVIVATDDKRIWQVVTDFGGKALMTASSHRSGTERCAEVYTKYKEIYTEHDTYVVNIQGDEPFIQVKQIQELIQYVSDTKIEIATLLHPIKEEAVLCNPNVVKAIITKQQKLLYFSRTAIPYLQKKSFFQHCFYKHIGLYVYKASTLMSLVALPPSSLEEAENLEQLRWLEHGYTMGACITNCESPVAIDTPEDLAVANNLYAKNHF